MFILRKVLGFAGYMGTCLSGAAFGRHVLQLEDFAGIMFYGWLIFSVSFGADMWIRGRLRDWLAYRAITNRLLDSEELKRGQKT